MYYCIYVLFLDVTVGYLCKNLNIPQPAQYAAKIKTSLSKKQNFTLLFHSMYIVRKYPN